jgi:hypothetical protein
MDYETYKRGIAPLVEQLRAACHTHQIPVLICVAYRLDQDGYYDMVTVHSPDEDGLSPAAWDDILDGIEPSHVETV